MNGKREYDLRDQERREQAANVRVGALCRVEKFDPAAMRVDVQPLSKALDAGVYRTQPQILSVPVALVRGGGFVLRPCYKSGDVGVLLYIDHDIDRIAALKLLFTAVWTATLRRSFTKNWVPAYRRPARK